MGQPLRITHHQQDYSFQLLTEQIDATTQEIAVQVGEAVLTLVKTERSWMPKAGEHDEMSELAQAIGKPLPSVTAFNPPAGPRSIWQFS